MKFLKTKRTFAIWIAVLAVGGTMIAGSVFAAGNIRLGRIKVKPSVKYEAEYNDNVFLSNKEEKDDVVHTVSPAISFAYEGNPGNYLETGYRGKFSLYQEYDDNNYQIHNPYLSFGLRSPGGFYLTFDENYKYTSDPYGSENMYNEGHRTRRWDNTAGLVLGYEFGRRFGIEGMYENYLTRYNSDEDQWQDRMDHKYGGTFLFNLSEKTSLLAQYRETRAEYTKQNDGVDGWTGSTSQDYTLRDYFMGVRFKPGGKLRGEAKFGWGEKDFKNDVDREGDAYQDQDTWVAETQISYNPVESSFLNFIAKRSHKGAPDSDASSYVDTHFGLDARQGFGDRFFLDLGLGWTYADYSDENPGLPKKYFTIYTVEAGIEYRIRKWLHAGLSYQYKNKEASDTLYEDEEYENNVITMTVNADF